MRQVLRNLLSNAVKYGNGGVIGVRVAATSPAPPDGGQIVVRVEDEGPGLSPAHLLHLFEPFERGARAGDGQGLGLGLALARRIALRLGGSLVAENRAVGGACFVFSLPVKAAVRLAPPPQMPAHRRLRILLAEDVPLVRRVVSSILQFQGHEVTEADDGEEAVSLFSALDFDLAILDLGMPGLNGLEVMDRIGAGRLAGAPPVILLTASGEADIAERARRAGAVLVLRKPVSAEELARAVHQASFVSARIAEIRTADVLAPLREEARLDLLARIAGVLAENSAGSPWDAAEAHRIAGLAAQFGWPRVAAAADQLERDILAGTASPLLALEALGQSRADLTCGDQPDRVVGPI